MPRVGRRQHWLLLEALEENLVQASLLAAGGGQPSSVWLDSQTHDSRLHLCLHMAVLPLCVYLWLSSCEDTRHIGSGPPLSSVTSC